MNIYRTALFITALCVLLLGVVATRGTYGYKNVKHTKDVRGGYGGGGHGGGNDDDDDGGQGSGNSCSTDQDCDDSNICTTDVCKRGKCCNKQTDSGCDPEEYFVRPILECVQELGEGQYVAHFGYKNEFWTQLSIPAGSPVNKFSPSPIDRGQPGDFSVGRQTDVFQVQFNGQNLVWTLKSPDGSTRTATASSQSTRCVLPECTSDADCDDQLRCTADICEDEVCVHSVHPYCEEEDEEDSSSSGQEQCDNCLHEVNLYVNDCSALTVVEHPQHVYEFCHTSTYIGNNSAVVLDFSPYQDCALNELGSCSNRHAHHEAPFVLCASDALPDQCTAGSADHAFYLPGLDQNLVWSDTEPATLTEDDQDGEAHLHGVLVGVNRQDLKLRVNVWFTGLVHESAPTPQGSPKKELKSSCYSEQGGVVVTDDWRYYSDLQGTLVAEAGSAYEGLHISLVHAAGTPAAQFGVGANGKNTHIGMSTWVDWQVTQQPNDHYLPSIDDTSRGDINIDLSADCNEELDYCSLFGEPQPIPANEWTVTLSDDLNGHHYQPSNITYCRNFTLEQLWGCHNFTDSYNSQFHVENNQEEHSVHYSGVLYATTLLPTHCQYHSSEECGEEKLFGTRYEVDIWINADGTTSVAFQGSSIGLSAEWLRNLWLSGEDRGNLQVFIETRIKHIDATDQNPFTTRLVHPTLDAQHETGYPLSFLPEHDLVPPPCRNEGGYCYQVWALRSYDALEVVDFSGEKPLSFWVEVNGEQRVRVNVRVHLVVKHIGSQVHLEGHLDAALQLYTDPQFQHPYSVDSGNSIIDCEYLFGVLRLIEHDHLRVRIKRVSLCFSENGNILAYDPLYPESTGCNSTNVNVVKYLLYSEEASEQGYIEDETHHFTLRHDPPYGPHQEGFGFQAHAFTQFKQLLQVQWYAEEDGGHGAVIEQITEISLDGEAHTSRSEHSYDHSHYTVTCPYNDWHYDYDLHRCVYDRDYAHGVAAFLFFTLLLFLLAIILYTTGWACCCCCSTPWAAPSHVVVSESQRPVPSVVYQQQQQQQQHQTTTHVYVDDRDNWNVNSNNGNTGPVYRRSTAAVVNPDDVIIPMSIGVQGKRL